MDYTSLVNNRPHRLQKTEFASCLRNAWVLEEGGASFEEFVKVLFVYLVLYVVAFAAA